MREHPRWSDAIAAARRLTADDRRTLLLLARLPFLWPGLLAQLSGLRGGASVYRCVDRLKSAGLVDTARVAFRPSRPPGLLYLTDLGLATVALDRGVDVRHLARRNGLAAPDLLRELPGLPHLAATYELLGALARSRPGRPDLLAWERPWRRRFYRPTAKAPVRVRLPAYAALSWEDDPPAAAAYLLMPDLGTFPLRAYRSALAHRLDLRASAGDDLPVLIIATTDGGRAGAWEGLLEGVRRARREAPLLAHLTTWPDPPGGLTGLEALGERRATPARALVQRMRLQPLRPGPAARPIPRLVGGCLHLASETVPNAGRPSRAALGLRPPERAILDLVGRHPFLSIGDIAAAFGWTPDRVRRHRNRLIALGLVRLLTADEMGARAAAPQLAELTLDGLEFLAGHQGLSLGMASRFNGLVGGGPDRAVGPRTDLLTHLEHTIGVNRVFVNLCQLARESVGADADDALVEWRNAATCGRRNFRPDGYGLYRRDGKLFGFFLEYDRGTMSARDYRQKFAAYHDYRASGRFDQDYVGFPTILVITNGPGPEDRIASAVRAVGTGREPPLPVLLTTTGRIEGRPEGLLGPIWRGPYTRSRRRWPAGPESDHRTAARCC
jgi:hypothetical protein